MPWHNDEFDPNRIWHDGDVSPIEWHWATKDKRDSMILLVKDTSSQYPMYDVVTVWLDIVDVEYIECGPSYRHLNEWPTTWRWAECWKLEDVKFL